MARETSSSRRTSFCVSVTRPDQQLDYLNRNLPRSTTKETSKVCITTGPWWFRLQRAITAVIVSGVINELMIKKIVDNWNWYMYIVNKSNSYSIVVLVFHQQFYQLNLNFITMTQTSLLNRLFRRRSKKTSKLRVTGLCAGNSPGTGEFPAQMASYAENVSIWWCHHVDVNLFCSHPNSDKVIGTKVCSLLDSYAGMACTVACRVPMGALVHDDVIKWKHFPRYWPFVRGIHRSPMNSPHKGQWRGALMFSLICARINGWVNNRKTGDLRRHRAHYDVIVMQTELSSARSELCWWMYGSLPMQFCLFKLSGLLCRPVAPFTNTD